MQTTTDMGRRGPLLAAGLTSLILILAACTGGSPSNEPASSLPAASEAPASQPAASEPVGAARCELTPDASSSATIELVDFAFGGEATIQAGQAVEFANNDTASHTVTEGTEGTALDDACVDEPLGAGATLVVTFNEPGDYDITCKLHSTMHTVVHVQ